MASFAAWLPSTALTPLAAILSGDAAPPPPASSGRWAELRIAAAVHYMAPRGTKSNNAND